MEGFIGYDIASLRAAARRAFLAAIARADPAAALDRALGHAPLPGPGPGGRTRVVALGKAAPAMLAELLPRLSTPADAICVTHRDNSAEVPGAQMFRAGHPVPDAVGAEAAAAVRTLLSAAGPEDVVIALISGGGSALLPAPPAGVSLDDKRALNALLLASGLDIMAMNLIRQQVSDLKGGGFLRLAAPAPVTAYILSDVIGDDLRAIASGPTVAPLGTRIEAATHLKSAGLWDRLPGAIRSHLGAPEPDRSPPPEATNHLIGSNRQSAEAAAQACRDAFDATLVEAPLVGDVADAAETVVRAARHALASPRPSALIWGGETTVVPTGPGLGGRNQELALRIAARTADLPGPVPWVFLSGGTDGRDGPTDAAGGLVDPQTADRLRRAGVDVARALADNDSNTALSASGDLVITGATGTNVADIQVFLTGGPAR